MRRLGAVAVIGIALAAQAYAAETIKPGKWEFSAQVQVPNMPQLPPGVNLPPNVNITPGRINVKRTACITAAAPMPSDMRPAEQRGQCKLDKMTRDGASVHWITSCVTSHGTVRTDGIAHYSGDTMTATLTTQQVGGGAALNSTQHISGRYLGPCDAK